MTTEAAELEREILAHVRALAPQLLSARGVGPIVAAQLIIAWSHPGRVRSEAAFIRLAGVAPIPASSGQTVRHRLSRGGDRQLNRALHTVILQRRQHDPATKAYIERRVSQGKSRRDAIRLVKRYLARTSTGYRKIRSHSRLDTSYKHHFLAVIPETAVATFHDERDVLPTRNGWRQSECGRPGAKQAWLARV